MNSTQASIRRAVASMALIPFLGIPTSIAFGQQPARSAVRSLAPAAGRAAPMSVARTAVATPEGIRMAVATTPTAAKPATAVRQATATVPAAATPLASTPSSPTPAGVANGGIVPASYVSGEPLVGSGDCMTGCMTGGCGPMPYSPLWGGVEYLMWWDKDADLPALVASSTTGTTADNAAVLGLNSTTVLLGNGQGQDDSALNGVRLTLGSWLDATQGLGIGGRLFMTEEWDDTFSANSGATPILGRPFFNAFTNEEDALLLGFPNRFRGDIVAVSEGQTQGAEVFLRHLRSTGCNFRCDLIYGYRYLGVDESLQINNNLEFIGSTQPGFGTVIEQQDRFEVENQFHGGEIGLMGHSTDGRWTLDYLATIAFGSMTQTTTISGFTRTTPANGAATTTDGGLLTQRSNIGVFEDDPFTVVPEGNVTLGYAMTPRMDVTIGYTFLYVSNVARVHNAIDRQVNLTQQTGDLDGPARPAFTVADSGYWLQGINFGLNLRY